MKMIRSKYRNKKSPRKSYCVFVEGETEKVYLNELKSDLGNNNVALTIEPKFKSSDLCSHKKNHEYFIKKLEDKKKEGYDKVFCLVDYDVILMQDRNTIDGRGKCSEKFEKIKEHFKKDSSKDNKIEILVNSPCLEFWFLLHFEDTAAEFNCCDNAISELKKYDRSFEKSIKGCKTFYKNYKDKIQTAINNAKNVDKEKNTKSKAQIYKLIEELLKK